MELLLALLQRGLKLQVQLAHTRFPALLAVANGLTQR
jgi:hypothetical protein